MEKDVGRLRKNDQTEIVIRIDDFGGKKGLTIREFVTSERYTGFTKSGVRIPAADFNEFKDFIDSIDESDLEETEQESEEKPSEEVPKGQKQLDESKEKDVKNSEDLPDY